MKKRFTLLACLLVTALSAFADEEKVQLKLMNAPVADALAYYGHLIGKQIVSDNTVQGSLTVVSDGLVSPSQAAAMLETTFFSNGFSLVDSADGTIVKVVGLGKSVRAEAPLIYHSVDELPKRERVVSLVVKLKHANAQEAQGFLAQYIPPNTMVSFTADPPSGTLTITPPTSLVRNAIKTLETIDVTEAASEAVVSPRPTKQPAPPPPTEH